MKPRPDQVIRREGVPPPAGVEPTFREFVDYMIETDLGSYGDDHWMPYYLFCTPCLVKYDIIAKVSETAIIIVSLTFRVKYLLDL